MVAVQSPIIDAVGGGGIDGPRQPNPPIGLHNRIQRFRRAITGVGHGQIVTDSGVFADYWRLLGDKRIP